MRGCQRAKAVVVSIPDEGIEKRFNSQGEAGAFLGVSCYTVSQHMRNKKGVKSLRLRGVKITEYVPVTKREHQVDIFPVQVGRGGRPIRQLDKYTNEVLNTFKNMTDAVKQLGLKPSAITGISRCARGEVQHAQGFKWEFADIDEYF